MTDKEFKRLRRPQLIEIIYELQLQQQKLIEEKEAMEQQFLSEKEQLREQLTHEKEELEQKLMDEKQQLREQLAGEIEELQSQLGKQQSKIENAGSIAEATLALSDIFDVAQKAADQYLAEVQQTNMQSKQQSEALVLNAQKEAAQIIETAERESAEIRQKTDTDIKVQWLQFNEKVTDVLRAHTELERYLNTREQQ